MRRMMIALAVSAALTVPSMAWAQTSNTGMSSARRMQLNAQSQIPVCTKNLGTLAIVPPDNEWWHAYSLGSPEAILKVFVQQSRCFSLVNRGSAMRSRAMERAMADNGELQAGSNVGRGQVKTADYFMQPDIVTANGAGSFVGAVAGGINVKKGEAAVTLDLVNARTTEDMALTQGYARKKDVSWGAGGGAGWWGGFAAAGGGGYQNTEIGQVIVLAYLDAYIQMVTQLGGLPANPSAAAPQAQ